MIYLQLFLRFLYIGILSFGGGYAVLPLIQQQCIETNGWLTMTDFSDLLTMSQITPGPIAINSATFVGLRVGGIPGAVVATLAFMIPPFLVVTVLFLLYRKFGELEVVQDILSALKPAVTGLIGLAALNVVIDSFWGEAAVTLANTDIFAAVLTLMTFFVLRKWKTGYIRTILACGAAGVVWELAAAALR